MCIMNNALGFFNIFHRYNKEIILTLFQQWFRLCSILTQCFFFSFDVVLVLVLHHQQAKRKICCKMTILRAQFNHSKGLWFENYTLMLCS